MEDEEGGLLPVRDPGPGHISLPAVPGGDPGVLNRDPDHAADSLRSLLQTIPLILPNKAYYC